MANEELKIFNKINEWLDCEDNIKPFEDFLNYYSEFGKKVKPYTEYAQNNQASSEMHEVIAELSQSLRIANLHKGVVESILDIWNNKVLVDDIDEMMGFLALFKSEDVDDRLNSVKSELLGMKPRLEGIYKVVVQVFGSEI